MLRTFIYPSSGACDCVDELPHRSSCSQFVVCWRFWCGRFLVVQPAKRTPPKTSRTKSSNIQRTENKMTDVVIHQHSRKLLKMDILMSETCWAQNKWNKRASDIKLVFHSSTIQMTKFRRKMRIYLHSFVRISDVVLNQAWATLDIALQRRRLFAKVRKLWDDGDRKQISWAWSPDICKAEISSCIPYVISVNNGVVTKTGPTPRAWKLLPTLVRDHIHVPSTGYASCKNRVVK